MTHPDIRRGTPAAIAAAVAAVNSRRAFLRRSALGVAGTAGALALAAAPRTFAAEADPRSVSSRAAATADKRNLTAIRKHENDHVAFLVQALGANARPKPTFQKLEQDTIRHFFATAQVLENVGVGAYLGAAPFIDDMNNLAAAGSIATIEARHAGYLNSRLNDPITAPATDLSTDESFETPFTAAEVAADAGGFVASLNGGPPLTYSTTPSPANDLAILNFALALEYLESDFYNINVPKFFA